MKTNVIILAKASLGNTPDMEFYNLMLRHDQENGLSKHAIILMFPSVKQLEWYLEGVAPGYRFILFIHMGNKSMNPPQDGEDLTSDLLNTAIGRSLHFSYISRTGESKYNGRDVIYAPKLVKGEYPLTQFQENTVGKEDISTSPKYDFAILTALLSDEHEAFDAAMNNVRQQEKNVKIGRFVPAKEGILDYQGDIVTMWQQDMGPIDAAAFSTRIISQYAPRFLIMGGVTGGLQTDVKLYDIIVPTGIFDYLSGKFSEGKLLPRPLTAIPSAELTGFLKENEIEIKRRMEDLAPLTMKDIVKNVTIHYKKYASGPWVMKTDGVLENMANINDVDIIGLEMESLGVVRAANLFAKHHKYALVAKSVMDFTDGNKTDHLNKVPVKKNAAVISYLYIRSAMPLLKEFVDPKI